MVLQGLQSFFNAEGKGSLELTGDQHVMLFKLIRDAQGALVVARDAKEYRVTLVEAAFKSFGGGLLLAEREDKMGQLAAGFFNMKSVGGIDFYHGATHLGRILVTHDGDVLAGMRPAPLPNLV